MLWTEVANKYQVVFMLIAVLLLSAIQFQWNIIDSPLKGSPLATIRLAVSLLLLFQLVSDLVL